jgi:hypothetical protein
MTIRLATPADNAALLALAGTLALPGVVRIGVDRAPDFFALDRMVGGTPHAMVVEADGRVVGFVDVCGIEARVGDLTVPAAQMSLAGMDRAYRAKGLFQPMLQDLEERLRAQDFRLAWGVTNAHNARAREFVAIWPHGCFVGEPIDLHVLLGDPWPRRAPRAAIRAATDDDLPRIDALVHAHRAAYDVAPVLPGGSVAGLAGLRASDFLVACAGDRRIVACLALWDQHEWRRTPVVGYGAVMRVLRGFASGAFKLGGRAPLPEVGDSFRFCHVAFPAAEPGAERVFADLLHAAAHALRERGLHFLALGLPKSDPLTPAVAGFTKVAMTAVPFLAPGDAEVAAQLARHAPPRAWFDYALT